MTDQDRQYLRQALDLAARGRALASPNPVVGAVVLDASGAKVGEGFHTYEGVQHAEVLALEQAGERARGGALYVTLEPCSHYGRTGPCSEAVVASGVKRVVAPLEDANPEVEGAGFAQLRRAGVQVEIAEEFRSEAAQLNEDFFHYMKTGRPLVTLKTAATLDGKIAAPDDNTGWITSERARKHVHNVRHRHDAILTGIGTVLEDDPMLNDRSGLARRRPIMRIVVDSLCRLPVESKLVESFQDDLVVMTTSAAVPKRKSLLEERGVPVFVMDAPKGRVDLKAVIDWAAKQRMLSLMIEAGAKLNWAALDEGVVDKILIYYAPKILGGLESLPIAGGVGPSHRRRSLPVIRVLARRRGGRNISRGGGGVGRHRIQPSGISAIRYVHNLV